MLAVSIALVVEILISRDRFILLTSGCHLDSEILPTPEVGNFCFGVSRRAALISRMHIPMGSEVIAMKALISAIETLA